MLSQWREYFGTHPYMYTGEKLILFCHLSTMIIYIEVLSSYLQITPYTGTKHGYLLTSNLRPACVIPDQGNDWSLKRTG